jgi:hypothetical protein
MTGAEVAKFLEPYFQWGLKLAETIEHNDATTTAILKDAQGNDFAVVGYGDDTLSVFATSQAIQAWDPVRRATPTPAPSLEPKTPEKNDCVIVAAENMKRLKDSSVWARIFAFKYLVNGQRVTVGHAVVVFKLTGEGSVLFVDSAGTSELRTTATDVESIKQAMAAKFSAAFGETVEIVEPKFLN